MIGIARDITKQKKVEELLTQANTDWEETFDTLEEAITIHDASFNILRANHAAERILGLPASSITAHKCFRSFHGLDHSPAACPSCEVLKTGKPATVELFEPHPSKSIKLRALPRFDADKRIIGIVHIVRDITEQKQAEEEQKRLQARFIQSQKMESVGRLASGIAHDFNNILTAIMGYSELALLNPAADPELKEQLKMINEAGAKAAELTRQLLAFSRQQVLEMKALDLNHLFKQMAKMLSRMIGEDITLELNLKPGEGIVLADRNQIEQVLMNLAVNARDAMPDGGRLIIETSDTEIDETCMQQRPEMKPGTYAVIAVSDTGNGMSSDVQEKVFEPFFTTKAMGKGTGLGLATVYGIVKQHNGFIYVYSEPGSGTTFKIYLPLAAGCVEENENREKGALISGTETVLIVDDELMIRKFAGDLLRPLGYHIIEAGSVAEALRLNSAYPNRIDLLLTDMIMPEMKGNELAKCFERERPGIKVIFMSGYSEFVVTDQPVYEGSVHFIQKPLIPSVLTGKLREVLDK